MTITVFTPSYNRAYILPKLYDSLCQQSCKDFEWLVVDDGSNDNTESLFKEWVKQADFSVHYHKVDNGGKHRAINKGVEEAHGELFFIVDSDDMLPPNSIERTLFYYEQIKNDDSFAGVCGLRSDFNGRRIGGEQDFGIVDCNSLDFRYKLNIKGDMAEVFRTSVLREFPFPEYDGEKFCPEALVFNRIAKRYKLRYFYEKTYLCEYLPDGLTAHIVKVRMQSPQASKDCYFDLCYSKVPFLLKIKSAINYWRFALCGKANFSTRVVKMLPYVFLFPVGLIMHIIDRKNVR